METINPGLKYARQTLLYRKIATCMKNMSSGTALSEIKENSQETAFGTF
jgi:hypothetical protein